MNYAQRLELWGDRHHPKWLDLLRICLGVFLCYKGVEFLSNMNLLVNAMENRFSFNAFAVVLLSHYVVFAHIMGGFLLVIGLLTRFACLIQIPLLLGAVFFVNTTGNFLRPFSELWLSIIILLLLICFLVVGNGPWSFEWFVKRDQKQHETST